MPKRDARPRARPRSECLATIAKGVGTEAVIRESRTIGERTSRSTAS